MKPFCAVTVIVDVLDVSPTLQVTLVGCAEMVKVGAPVTDIGMSIEWLRFGLEVPWTEMVDVPIGAVREH